MFKKTLLIIICLTINFNYAATLAPTLMYIDGTTLYSVNNKFSFQIPDLADYTVENNIPSAEPSLTARLTNTKRPITILISVSDIKDTYKGHNSEITKIMRAMDQENSNPNLLYVRRDSYQAYRFTKSLIVKTVNGEKIQNYIFLTNTQDKLLILTISVPEGNDEQINYIEEIINSFKTT